MSDELKPVAWRYVPSDVWGAQVVTQDKKAVELARQYGHDVEPLYTHAAIAAAVAAERERIANLVLSFDTGSSYRLREQLAAAIRQAPAE